jgi:hypothetical protein
MQRHVFAVAHHLRSSFFAAKATHKHSYQEKLVRFRLIALSILVVLTGCVATPQQPVSMESGFLNDSNKTVGVVMTKLPNPDVYLPGADCLLCMAAAEAMNSSLSKHVETLTPDDFKLVRSNLIQRMQEKGVNVVAIEETIDVERLPKHKSEIPNSARRDYSSYQSKYEITHLLVVDIDQMGLYRSYASYIPTSDPKAVLVGQSYLISLKDNTYKWYKPISIYKSAAGEWDESPAYPALTNAYYQVIETGREMVLSEF